MSKVFLLEDNENLGASLASLFADQGYEVTWAKSLAEAKSILVNLHPDIAVVDIGLPDGDGFEAARKLLRTAGIPFIFLTAQSSAESRLAGFEIGAEDYIPKPFHFKELSLRVQRVLEQLPKNKKLQTEGFSLDGEGLAIVFDDGRREVPQARDFQLLKLLVEACPRPVARSEMLEIMGAHGSSERSIDNSIVRLRQLLGEELSTSLRSVRGVGYQWLVATEVRRR